MQETLAKHDGRGDESTVHKIRSSCASIVCDIHESARLLSVSPGMIRKLLHQGRLRRINGIRKILVPRAALENLADN